jgi:sugar O-acyltransferase (sialic acid O-acetyltransferase NeuD family)
MKTLVIIGAGGAGAEAHWVALRQNAQSPRWHTAGFVDDNPTLSGQTVDGIPVLGGTAEVTRQLAGKDVYFHCAIGNNRQRQRMVRAWEAAGFRAATLVDPTAIVAETAQIGDGTFIGPLSIVAPHARVGRHVLINTHVGVGHHAEVGDFAQLCPGARVNGRCKVDTLAFLGSNAVVHPGLSIGEGASIGAGSFVIRSVKPRHSVLGVPARIVSRPAENGPNAQS